MDILRELLKYKKERSEQAPFTSLLEFEEWSDSVQPLLRFDENYNRQFEQAVLSAKTTYRMKDYIDANTNMNSAVGILNQAIAAMQINSSQNETAAHENFISLYRIEEIQNLKSDFDFSKLVKILNELNKAYGNELYYATGCLIRVILDHVPPIFNCKNFNEVANNYQGAKSFKEAMKGLNEQMRKISDSYLHTPIRKKEALPSKQQVEARSSVDLLLSEIIRLTEENNK